MIELIFKYCGDITNSRDIYSVFRHLDSEHQELYRAIFENVDDEDGVVGEAIDVILCAVDIIFQHNPDLTEQDLLPIVQRKLDKWKTLYGKR